MLLLTHFTNFRCAFLYYFTIKVYNPSLNTEFVDTLLINKHVDELLAHTCRLRRRVLDTGAIMFQKSGSTGAHWQRRWALALTFRGVKDFTLAHAAIFDSLGAQVTLACLDVPHHVFTAFQGWKCALTLACCVVPRGVWKVAAGSHFALTLARSAVPILFRWITTAPGFLTFTAATLCVVGLGLIVAIFAPRLAVTVTTSVIVDCNVCETSIYLKNAYCNLFLACHRAVFN